MANKLENLEEFKKVLKDYRISDAGKQILAKTKLALLVGPTAAGRNTIIDALLKTGEYHPIVSDTTRKPRQNNGVWEQNSREYWFKPEEEVLGDLKAGKFLEAALIHNQQVSGISLRELEQANKEGKIAVNEIEIVGMQNIIEAKPDAYAFFVVPPSFDIWMQRLEGRGTMSAADKQFRLESAVKEFETALKHKYYIFLVNDTFQHSVERMHQIINGEQDSSHQELGRKTVEHLLEQTKEYLRR